MAFGDILVSPVGLVTSSIVKMLVYRELVASLPEVVLFMSGVALRGPVPWQNASPAVLQRLSCALILHMLGAQK